MAVERNREAKEREQDAFIQRTRTYLNSLFTHTGKPFFYLQEILQYMQANCNNPIYRKAILSEIRNHETRLYDDFISVLSDNDFETASKGMQLLCDACPGNREYREALDILKDRRKLLTVMEQNGLSKSSPMMKRHTDILK